MSSTAIKLLALVFMLFDHIHAFIPNVPVWFTWIGRLAAPMFVFCVVWSLYYTHDRRKYLLRLYLFGILMGVGDYVVTTLVGGEPVRTQLANNIFSTMLLVGVIVWLIELFLQKKWLPALLGTAAFAAVQYFICFPLGMLTTFGTLLTPDQVVQAVHVPHWAASFFTSYGSPGLVDGLLPSVMTNEGGPVFVLFGVLLYFCRKNKGLVAACFAGLAIVGWYTSGHMTTLHGLLFEGYEWMSIFALPFVLSFNGQKGKGYKYLFYVFYPAHIWLLYIAGNLMAR